VPCRVCKKWLRSFKVCVHFKVEKYGDIAMVFEYECYRCYAKLNNITLGEAIQKIIEQRPDNAGRGSATRSSMRPGQM
ncbi:MAG: hypothetical protein ACKPKO_56635, partial [Candidatus Fonsibacter sp.]